MCALRCNFANILLATKEREQMEKGEREREREREEEKKMIKTAVAACLKRVSHLFPRLSHLIFRVT